MYSNFSQNASCGLSDDGRAAAAGIAVATTRLTVINTNDNFFFTTCSSIGGIRRFTADAQDYADRVAARLVLIDAAQLGQLMVRHSVGVQEEETFVLKEVDEDYFET